MVVVGGVSVVSRLHFNGDYLSIQIDVRTTTHHRPTHPSSHLPPTTYLITGSHRTYSHPHPATYHLYNLPHQRVWCCAGDVGGACTTYLMNGSGAVLVVAGGHQPGQLGWASVSTRHLLAAATA